MSRNIAPYYSTRQNIDDFLYKFKMYPATIREREIVIYCSYSSIDDYYIGCGWRYIGDKNSCTVYHVLNIESCYDFTEQMYKDIQLELERKVKEAFVEKRKKELEKDFENDH